MSSPTTTRRPWSSRRPPDRPSRRPSSRHRRSSSSPSPESGRSAWTPPRRFRTSSGRSRSPRQDTPNAPRRSPASARPPCQAGRYAEAAEALEEAIASFRDRGDIPAAARAMGTLGNVLRPTRGPAAMDAPGGGARAAGAARAVPRARRGAHRGGRRRCPPGEVRGRDPHRRPGAGSRRGARPRPSRARPRLPGDGPRRPRGPRRSRRTTARRSSSRPRPGRDARSPCSTTTSGCNLWSFEGPAASLEVLREGIAYAKARGLTEMLDALTQSIARRARRYG